MCRRICGRGSRLWCEGGLGHRGTERRGRETPPYITLRGMKKGGSEDPPCGLEEAEEFRPL